MTVSQIVKKQFHIVAAQYGFKLSKGHFYYRSITPSFNDYLDIQCSPHRPKCDKVTIDFYLGIHIQKMRELCDALYEEQSNDIDMFPVIGDVLYHVSGDHCLYFSINDDIEVFQAKLASLFEKHFEPYFINMHSWRNIQKRVLSKNIVRPSWWVAITYYFNGDKKKGLKVAMQHLNAIQEEYRQPQDYAFVENFAKLPPYKGDFNIDMMK